MRWAEPTTDQQNEWLFPFHPEGHSNTQLPYLVVEMVRVAMCKFSAKSFLLIDLTTYHQAWNGQEDVQDR